MYASWIIGFIFMTLGGGLALGIKLLFLKSQKETKE